jgi:hypothetical protein
MNFDNVFFAKLRDSGVPLTDGDISEFESELGTSLPAEYRSFLLFRNGGRFYEEVVFPLPADARKWKAGTRVYLRCTGCVVPSEAI